MRYINTIVLVLATLTISEPARAQPTDGAGGDTARPATPAARRVTADPARPRTNTTAPAPRATVRPAAAPVARRRTEPAALPPQGSDADDAAISRLAAGQAQKDGPAAGQNRRLTFSTQLEASAGYRVEKNVERPFGVGLTGLYLFGDLRATDRLSIRLAINMHVATNYEFAMHISEAFAVYALGDWMQIRVGFMLSDLGQAVKNFYPALWLSSLPPALIAHGKVLPTNALGVGLNGRFFFGKSGEFGYALTAGVYIKSMHAVNVTEAGHGHDTTWDRLGSTGRVRIKPFKYLELGLNYYANKRTYFDPFWSLGADLKIEVGGFGMIGEYWYTVDEEQDSFQNVYGQVHYRLPKGFTPFFRYEYHAEVDDHTGANPHEQHAHTHGGYEHHLTAGLNYAPIPQLRIKLEYIHAIHTAENDHHGTIYGSVVAIY